MTSSIFHLPILSTKSSKLSKAKQLEDDINNFKLRLM